MLKRFDGRRTFGLAPQTLIYNPQRWTFSTEAEDGLEEKDSSSTFSVNSSPLVKKQMLMIWMDIKSVD